MYTDDSVHAVSIEVKDVYSYVAMHHQDYNTNTKVTNDKLYSMDNRYSYI